MLVYDKSVGGYRVDRKMKLEHHLLEDPGSIAHAMDTGTDLSEYGGYVFSAEVYTETEEGRSSHQAPPPGVFEIRSISSVLHLVQIPLVESDAFIDLPGPLHSIIEEIELFLSQEAAYRAAGMVWKRGLLLYGPPGCGKSMVIRQMISRMVQQQKIRAILVDYPELLDGFRNELTDMPTLCVIEELTECVRRNPQRILDFLDGEKSWPACMTIATTNYPEQLDANIVDRPSRFDKLYFVDFPTAEVRQLYLTSALGEPPPASVVEQTAGWSIAYLKELVLQHRLTGVPFADVIDQAKSRKKQIKRAFSTASLPGFGDGDE